MAEPVEKPARDQQQPEALAAAEVVLAVRTQIFVQVDLRFSRHLQAAGLAMLEHRQYQSTAEEAVAVPVVPEMEPRLETEFLPRSALEHFALVALDTTAQTKGIRPMPQATRATADPAMTAALAETEEVVWFVFVTNFNNGSLFKIRGD